MNSPEPMDWKKEFSERFGGLKEDGFDKAFHLIESFISSLLAEKEAEILSLKENVNGLGCQLSGYESKIASQRQEVLEEVAKFVDSPEFYVSPREARADRIRALNNAEEKS